MKRIDRKSACPVNFCLEAVGDTWSLLILRDIAFFGRHTYKEFLLSGERITTSVLAQRLANLEKHKIIRAKPHPTDKRRDVYTLTEKGLGLVPLLLDMMEWGTTNDPKSAGHRKEEVVGRIRVEQGALCREVQGRIRHGGALFDIDSSRLNVPSAYLRM